MLLPFGRALTSRLIEPLVLRLAASECWRAVRRGWVRVLCVFVILRSDSEEAAATAWRPAGKGHSDSVVPPAVADFFWHDSTAPPARYAVAAGLTAEEVRKGLGFGVHPLRLQKTAVPLRLLS